MRVFLISIGLTLLSIPVCFAGELDGHKLVTSNFRAGDPEIFVVDLGTGDALNLTPHSHSYNRYPAWAPDGSRVSFVSDRDGTFNLYLVNADGTNLRQLTHEVGGAIVGMQSWTADGRWIYFGLFGKDVAPPWHDSKNGLICRISPDGSAFQIVGEGIDGAVSPDGSRIVFARNLSHGHALFLMNSDGSDVHQITTHEDPLGGVHATWSPDGRKIIYADSVGDALELFMCEPDGKNIHQLTALGKGATSPAVSPDQKYISFRLAEDIYWRDGARSDRAYKERKADLRPVWVMGFDGSNPHIIEPLHYQTMIDGSRASWKPK
jgi:TolB protein